MTLGELKEKIDKAITEHGKDQPIYAHFPEIAKGEYLPVVRGISTVTAWEKPENQCLLYVHLPIIYPEKELRQILVLS
jgi:hypothetical protein